MKKTPFELDTLTELASISAGNSATALGKFVGKKIDILKPTVSITYLENVSSQISFSDTEIRAIVLKINHQVSGIYVMLMTVGDSQKLANELLLSQHSEKVDDAKVLKELGNIMCGATINALSDFLHLDISTSIPAVTVDMTDAILSTLASQLGEKTEEILIFENNFVVGNINLSTYYLFDPTSTDNILNLTNHRL